MKLSLILFLGLLSLEPAFAKYDRDQICPDGVRERFPESPVSLFSPQQTKDAEEGLQEWRLPSLPRFRLASDYTEVRCGADELGAYTSALYVAWGMREGSRARCAFSDRDINETRTFLRVYIRRGVLVDWRQSMVGGCGD